MFRVAYCLTAVAFGVGQTNTVSEILSYGQTRWASCVIAGRVSQFPREARITEVTDVSRRYLLAPLDERVHRKLLDCDIVHVFSGLPYLVSALRARRPSIYVVMQPDPLWLFSGRERLTRYAVRLLERPTLIDRAEVVQATSPWVAAWYEKRYHIKPIVITDSFDTTRFGSPPVDLEPTQRLTLICVGDWDGPNGRKRTHELIAAMPAITGRYSNACLKLVGLSDVAISFLSEMARRLGVSASVELKGKVSTDELVYDYHSASIYVAPTVVEGFYRPIVEAFASGLPAIVRADTGLVDPVCLAPLHHVNASGAGCAYDGSTDSLLAAIARVLETSERLVSQATSYARRFDNSTVLPQYANLYRKLLPDAS